MTDRLKGRELDAAVAEQCFGCTVKEELTAERKPRKFLEMNYPPYLAQQMAKEGRLTAIPLPLYSKSMGSAATVMDWMTEKGYHVEMQVSKDSAICEVWNEDWTIAVEMIEADTLAAAICYAALELARQLKGERE